eukprot:ANDGO_05889.mRNA.1 hypothetical protein
MNKRQAFAGVILGSLCLLVLSAAQSPITPAGWSCRYNTIIRTSSGVFQHQSGEYVVSSSVQAIRNTATSVLVGVVVSYELFDKQAQYDYSVNTKHCSKEDLTGPFVNYVLPDPSATKTVGINCPTLEGPPASTLCIQYATSVKEWYFDATSLLPVFLIDNSTDSKAQTLLTNFSALEPPTSQFRPPSSCY